MDIQLYSVGIVTCSACVPKDMSIEDIEKGVNTQLPTGISSRWAISKDKTFRQGKSNPCECDQDSNKKHYLLNC